MPFKGSYIEDVEQGNAWLRQLDWSGSASLMIAANSILWRSSPVEFQTLFLWIFFQIAIVFIGYLDEVMDRQWTDTASDSTKRKVIAWSFYTACVIYLGSWITLFLTFAANFGNFDGDPSFTPPLEAGVVFDDPPVRITTSPPFYPACLTPTLHSQIFVYLFSFFLFASFALFPVVTWLKLRLDSFKCKRFEINWGSEEIRMLAYENVYSSLSFFSKVPLLITYGSGVLFQGSDVVQIASDVSTTPVASTTSPSGSSDRNTVTIVLFAISIVVSTVGGITFLFLFRRRLKTATGTKGVQTELTRGLLQKQRRRRETRM